MPPLKKNLLFNMHGMNIKVNMGYIYCNGRLEKNV